MQSDYIHCGSGRHPKYTLNVVIAVRKISAQKAIQLQPMNSGTWSNIEEQTYMFKKVTVPGENS